MTPREEVLSYFKDACKVVGDFEQEVEKQAREKVEFGEDETLGSKDFYEFEVMKLDMLVKLSQFPEDKAWSMLCCIFDLAKEYGMLITHEDKEPLIKEQVDLIVNRKELEKMIKEQ